MFFEASTSGFLSVPATIKKENKIPQLQTLTYGAWWLSGRFDALPPEGRRFESHSSRHVGTLGKSFTRSCLWRFGVKLRHSICAVPGMPLRSSGHEEAL